MASRRTKQPTDVSVEQVPWTPGSWTATNIAADVHSGRRSATEIVGQALDRIARFDPALGAFQVIRDEHARAEAADVDSHVAAGTLLPLAGVPIAIKDNVAVAGEPMRDGSRATDAAPQLADHEVVRRLRAAGAIVVGITRVPELCVFGATDSSYGITRNPWDPRLTSGGSSGGSATAVSSGMVPVAHGNDGMGSIRIPAACSGLVGIKPGTGIVPSDLGANDWYGMAENGILATTVADTALLLSVMAADPAYAVIPEGARLRVAVSATSPVVGVSPDVDVVRALFDTAAVLMSAGHIVERQSPTYPTAAAVAGLARWFAGAAGDAEHLDPDLLEPRTRTHVAIGRAAIRAGLLSDSPRVAWQRKALQFLTTWDVLLTPVLASVPLEATAWGEKSWAASMKANVQYAPYSAPWNVAGFPAMTVPMGIHPASLTPFGVQLVARPGRESVLLALAAELEVLAPWPRFAPSYAHP